MESTVGPRKLVFFLLVVSSFSSLVHTFVQSLTITHEEVDLKGLFHSDVS